MTINWSPTLVEEVQQNVDCLLATAPGSVPLARALGTPQDLVDSPESTAGALLQANIMEAVATYEPRVKVKRVRLTADANGRLSATVSFGAP